MLIHSIQSDILSSHRLFASLNEDELNTLMHGAKLLNLSRGETLFHQNSPAKRFYFVINGQVKLIRTIKDGTEKIIDIVNRNNTFAEAIAFKESTNYPVSAQAVENTEVFAFRNEDYREVLRNNSELALILLGEMSVRLHGLISEIEVLSLKNSTLRVARYFLTLIGDDTKDDDTLELPVTKRLIASQLAMQPETLSRIFHKLRERGLIDIHGSSITVLNRAGLEMCC